MGDIKDEVLIIDRLCIARVRRVQNITFRDGQIGIIELARYAGILRAGDQFWLRPCRVPSCDVVKLHIVRIEKVDYSLSVDDDCWRPLQASPPVESRYLQTRGPG